MLCEGCGRTVRKLHPINGSPNKLCSNCYYLLETGIKFFKNPPYDLQIDRLVRVILGFDFMRKDKDSYGLCFICWKKGTTNVIYLKECSEFFDLRSIGVCKACCEFILAMRGFHIVYKGFTGSSLGAKGFLQYIIAIKESREEDADEM
ncbi:MAG: hypothetical protein ACTSQY_00550 [Candidatus Odinarchaeia archaeon]|nr:MAG: hypothetical protein [Lokiarchaeota virus Fenrir Meg22_1012]URC17291.1 MAG: hypothetical protein [Lokiarchaeota virus Fenrir Meg22_1214]